MLEPRIRRRRGGRVIAAITGIVTGVIMLGLAIALLGFVGWLVHLAWGWL